MSQATVSERPYLNSNLFSGHYLDERIELRDEWDCDDEAAEAMESLRSLYELEGDLFDGYGEDALIDNWISEVLEVLGFGTQVETTLPEGGGYVDTLLFENEGTRRDAASVYLDTQETSDLFDRGVGLLEAKQWDDDFTQRFSEQRPYRNASHQIKHYLERTPENIQWGILTNGRKWRLYGTKDYETQTYYEIDLPELLEHGDLETFKYFYVFFRPAAFRESSGITFLESVWSESETVAQELGEDLQNNVFTALRVLGRGFVETNDLDIDPDNEEKLEDLKEQSLVLLYRLMFVLYAESRDLIHPEGQEAIEEYEANFSLDELRLEIHDEIGEIDKGFKDTYSKRSTRMWSQLEDLFRLVDEGDESLGIPPYNGGLFNQKKHEFLASNAVSNRYLAEVIYRISTTENDKGRYVLADYADLDTRHLGSVYEGLLEHQFRIAPEEYAAVSEDDGQVWKPATEVTVADAVETVSKGSLYVVNDEGERKATGAYYTPDYVVTYIVEETVGPLVDEIREELIRQGFEPGTQEYLGPFLRRVTDMNILDPAMGSGHFLTKATDYLSEQVMAEVRDVEAEMGVAFNEQHVRREIAKECIYGVDLNSMAVELAKLSMWLETLAADRPLAFLDHHLKEGNSLFGSDIEAIEELESDTNGNEEQYSLAEFGNTREGTIERLMDIYGEFLAIENETVEDVREMKQKYGEIEQDELRQRLVTMANVHAAERFGLHIPSGAYQRMAKAIENDDDWVEIQREEWFNPVREFTDEKNFFHWKLEFPEIFYGEEGGVRPDAGFDAVIGNPPYFRIHKNWGKNSEKAEFIKNVYPDIWGGKSDIYYYFAAKAIEISNKGGKVSFITSRYFLEAHFAKGLREMINEKSDIDKIIDFGNNSVFKGVGIKVCIFLLDSAQELNNSETQFFKFPNKYSERNISLILDDLMSGNGWESIDSNKISSDSWNSAGWVNHAIASKIDDIHVKLGDISEIGQGMQTGKNSVFEVSQETIEEYGIDKEYVEKLAKNQDIGRYGIGSRDLYIIYPEKIDSLENHEGLFDYLSDHEDALKSRAAYERGDCEWYKYTFPLHKDRYDSEKIVTPFVAPENRFALDEDAEYICLTDTSAIFPSSSINSSYLLGLLNSKLLEFRYKLDAKPKDYRYEYFENRLKEMPIKTVEFETTDEAVEESVESVINEWEAEPESYDRLTNILEIEFTEHVMHNVIAKLVDRIVEWKSKYNEINSNILDYIQPYSEGAALANIGTYQPPEGVSNSMLAATKNDYENLRAGKITCERKSVNTVLIKMAARYKPTNEDDYETDQWGYTESRPMPAIQLTDLSETEADLVEAFVPIAVNKAGGFADFRETATKTNSLVDRLEALRLPMPDDVADSIDRYRNAIEHAEELEVKIEKTDELIDEIVYELYGLTEEEIEIVEETVEK